jgi:hypothetical protein
MKHLLSELGFRYVTGEIGPFTYFFVNIRDDKLVFILEINSLDQIREFVSLLHELRHKIFQSVKNQEPNGFTRVTLPGFLWDLYVIGMHDVSENPLFNQHDVTQLERDRFLARKIIIEFTDDNDAKQQLINQLLPEVVLDQILDQQETNIDELQQMSQKILQEVILDDDVRGQNPGIKEIISYLDKIINQENL